MPKDFRLETEVKIKAFPRDYTEEGPLEQDAFTIIGKYSSLDYVEQSDLQTRADVAAAIGGGVELPDPQLPPTATIAAPSDVLATSATFNGSVNAQGVSTTVTFVWGTDLNNPDQEDAAAESPVTGSSDTAVSFAATLVAATTYYYRVKAVAGGTTVYSQPYAFTTPAA